MVLPPTAAVSGTTGEQIVAPLQPPAIPPFNDLATPAHNAAIQVTWHKNKELWDQRKNVNKALIEITKSALDVAHRPLLTNLFVDTPQRTFIEFYNLLFVKWGQANSHDLVANEEQMKIPWDPNEHDIADVIKQIRDSTLFGKYVGQNFDNKRLVTVGEKIILDTGLFAQQ